MYRWICGGLGGLWILLGLLYFAFCVNSAWGGDEYTVADLFSHEWRNYAWFYWPLALVSTLTTFGVAATAIATGWSWVRSFRGRKRLDGIVVLVAAFINYCVFFVTFFVLSELERVPGNPLLGYWHHGSLFYDIHTVPSVVAVLPEVLRLLLLALAWPFRRRQNSRLPWLRLMGGVSMAGILGFLIWLPRHLHAEHSALVDEFFEGIEKVGSLAESGELNAAIDRNEENLQLIKQMKGEFQPNDLSTLCNRNRIKLLRRAGRFEDGIAFCSENLDRYRTDRGIFRSRAGDHVGALEDLELATEEHPERGYAWWNFAEVVAQSEGPEKGLQIVERGLEHEPGEGDFRGRLHHWRAFYLLLMKDHKQACEALADAIHWFRQANTRGIEGAIVLCLGQRARCSLEGKNLVEARWEIDEALKTRHASRHFDLLAIRGAVSLAEDKPQDAINDCTDALKLNPQSLLALNTIIAAHHRLGEYDKLQAYMDRLAPLLKQTNGVEVPYPPPSPDFAL